MKKVSAALLALLCLLLTACQSDAPGTEAGGDSALETVTLVLDYVPNTNHTGFYVAQELGYYAEAGLELRIIEPADNTVSTLIGTNQAEFGISYQEDVTYARAAAEPLPIRAIAAIIQHNTSGFAWSADKDISSPADFEGKVYSGWGSPSEEAVINAVMTADGGDFDKLTLTTYDGSGFSVLTKNVDLLWLFWAWDGIAAQRADVPLEYLELRELDPRLDYYTPVIIASEETLENRAEMTRQFLDATSRGYEYCMRNPAEAAAILHKYTPEYELDMLVDSQTYLADKYAQDVDRWGEMKASVWADYTAFMLEYDLIDQAIAPEACYTNEFLPG